MTDSAPVPGRSADDPFAVLDIPPRLAADEAALEKKVLDLNRTWHPDRAAEGGTDLATAKSAAINAAYRAIRSATARAKAWLAIHGVNLETARSAAAGAIAMRGFEIQEALDEAASGDASAAERLRGLEEDVAADRKSALERLRKLADEEPVDGPPPPAFVAAVTAALTELNYLDRQAERIASATETT